jgi:ActR/RegA family two-component response regulator
LTPAAGNKTQTILVVEDEPVTAMMLVRAVQAGGLNVEGPHADAARAEAAARRGGLRAALLDVSLGGDSTSAAVAGVLDEAGVPFAFVTGYGPETAPTVRAYPDRLVIPKPVDSETLQLILDELVGQG